MILLDILISFYIFFEIGEKPIEKKPKYIILKIISCNYIHKISFIEIVNFNINEKFSAK